MRSSLYPFAQIVLVVFLLADVLGCSPEPPQITIEEPSGELSPVFIGAGSFYLKIRNNGGRDSLTGAAVSFPQAVTELHEVKERRMVRIEKIDIPSRETVELKPGSLHIMAFNLPKTVQAGEELVLTLRFQRTGEKHVPVRIR